MERRRAAGASMGFATPIDNGFGLLPSNRILSFWAPRLRAFALKIHRQIGQFQPGGGGTALPASFTGAASTENMPVVDA